MIHACDECAKKHGLTMRCAVSDGPFGCKFCGKSRAQAVWSQNKEGSLFDAIKGILFLVSILWLLFVAVANLVMYLQGR